MSRAPATVGQCQDLSSAEPHRPAAYSRPRRHTAPTLSCYGTDPEHDTYRSRAHLAEIIALLGPPPPGLVARGSLRSGFFSEQGPVPSPASLPRAAGPNAVYLLPRGIPSRYQASRLFGTIGEKSRKFRKKAVSAIYEQDVVVEPIESADGEATS